VGAKLPSGVGSTRVPRLAVVAYTEYLRDPRVRREAESLVEAGYLVHAIALRPRDGRSPAHVGGVHLHEVPLSVRRGGKLRYAYQYLMFFLLSTIVLARLHSRRPFDLVHVHSLPDFQAFCGLPVRMTGGAVLLDLHEAMPEILASRFRIPASSVWVRLAAFLERVSCEFANHVIVANDGIRAALLARGLNADHVTAVYNPGDGAGPIPKPEEIARALRVPQGPLIVHAGGINPERDLETLFRAVAQLPAVSAVNVIVAGDGDPSYVRELGQLADRLGIGSRVLFVGNVSREEALSLMSLATIGVVTLKANPLTELAWPSRITEFARLRKPLVVPRLRFVSETLADGARYYRPGDADSLAAELHSALVGLGSMESSLAKADAICSRFEWSRMRPVLMSIYKALEGPSAS